jgi:hypothetical protein
MRWNGFACEDFNVGKVRRAKGLDSSASFFGDGADQNNVREALADEAQEIMYVKRGRCCCCYEY